MKTSAKKKSHEVTKQKPARKPWPLQGLHDAACSASRDYEYKDAVLNGVFADSKRIHKLFGDAGLLEHMRHHAKAAFERMEALRRMYWAWSDFNAAASKADGLIYRKLYRRVMRKQKIDVGEARE